MFEATRGRHSAVRDDTQVTVGVRLPYELQRDTTRLRDFVVRAEQAGLDRLCLGDHVTFKGGNGFDGLQNATAAAVLSSRITVETAVYLLPLRHPVPVARQVTSLASLAPGRFVFGVGLGGDDPAELRACGVDPAVRGRRMDESLAIVRALLAGEAVTVEGRFFAMDAVRVLPPPPSPVPIVVGGRSSAALRRTARFGDGWLGLWVSPRRYAEACAEIEREADSFGRGVDEWAHGMHVWCGFDSNRGQAGARLAGEMESLYRVPFEKFARYSPYGSARDVADALRPYAEVGCRSFNLIATAGSAEHVIEGARTVRELLRDEAPG
jgi:alkanesulfonate monooxygenase SsuD/methylene tetrahydromethanopterin reductase-like flavin-dependent oxidoreductase (luciferase family)